MLLIKDKLNDNSLKTSQKLQILTMTSDWPTTHVTKYFNASEHMVCEALTWLGRREFWHFLNLNVASTCQKKLKIRSNCFTKMMNICGWCQEQKIMLALQGMFTNKSVCYSVTWRSYTSHTRRSFPSTRFGCQSFVNSDLIGKLQSPYLVLILYMCLLSTKTQN